MNRMLAVILIAAGAANYPATAVRAAPADASMLAPGIYTTPEISRRCQTYARGRVSNSGAGDSERQSVFLACVQKLYRDENGGAANAPAAGPAFVEAPVSLPTYDIAPYGYVCSTDEGYGRRGSCDTY